MEKKRAHEAISDIRARGKRRRAYRQTLYLISTPHVVRRITDLVPMKYLRMRRRPHMIRLDHVEAYKRHSLKASSGVAFNTANRRRSKLLSLV